MSSQPVREVMTPSVVTIHPDDPVTDAARAMLDAGIGSLVIVGENNHPEGILTRTDFVALATDEDAYCGTSVPAVSSLMETDILSVSPGDTLAEAVETMSDHSIHHLPVVNDDGEVVGIVTTTDLADTAYDEL